MDSNRTQQNETNMNNDEPAYMTSRLRTQDIPRLPKEIDCSRCVQVRNCNCHMLTHFKSSEGCVCIRNMKPFLVEHEKSTLRIINENIVKAISSVFERLSSSTKKNSNDEEKEK